MTKEEIEKEIGFEAAKYAKSEDEGVLGINATKFNAVVHGATFGYNLAAAENEELRKELEIGKERISELENSVRALITQLREFDEYEFVRNTIIKHNL